VKAPNIRSTLKGAFSVGGTYMGENMCNRQDWVNDSLNDEIYSSKLLQMEDPSAVVVAWHGATNILYMVRWPEVGGPSRTESLVGNTR
jgi:hypothetical protein